MNREEKEIWSFSTELDRLLGISHPTTSTANEGDQELQRLQAITSVFKEIDFTDEICMSQDLQAKLSSTKPHVAQNYRSLSKYFFSGRYRLAALVILATLAITALVFATPQGQAWGQNLVKYFTRAESDHLPLPSGQPSEPPPPTRTVAPTRIAEVKKVTPIPAEAGRQGFPTPTPDQNYRINSGDTIWGLTVEEAQELAGFKINLPGSLPPGYRLDKIIYKKSTIGVAQLYQYHPYQSGEFFFLIQERSQAADKIGPSAAVEQLSIGGFEVEYVPGQWSTNAGAGSEEWHSDSPVHTFRWHDGELYNTLQFWLNETFSPAYLTKSDMIAMVEIVMSTRSTFPQEIDLNNLASIKEAEEVAGFDILEPSILPEGFAFSHGVYEPENERMVLQYRPEDGSRASSGVKLVIFEIPRTALETDHSWDGYPPDMIETVTIGNLPGTFIRGSYVDGIYDPNVSDRVLVWETEKLWIKILFWSTDWHPARLEKEEMVAVAESMK